MQAEISNKVHRPKFNTNDGKGKNTSNKANKTHANPET